MGMLDDSTTFYRIRELSYPGLLESGAGIEEVGIVTCKRDLS